MNKKTRPSREPRSLLRRLDESLKGKDRARLFAAVSERIRTELLTHDEAQLISSWFDRLRDGETPARVFLGETRGRRRGGTNTKYLRGEDVRFPEHEDLCWSLRQAIARTGDPDKVFAHTAKSYGKTTQYIRELYARIEPTLAEDPTLK